MGGLTVGLLVVVISALSMEVIVAWVLSWALELVAVFFVWG